MSIEILLIRRGYRGKTIIETLGSYRKITDGTSGC